MCVCECMRGYVSEYMYVHVHVAWVHIIIKYMHVHVHVAWVHIIIKYMHVHVCVYTHAFVCVCVLCSQHSP